MAYFVADEKLQGYYVSGGVTINIVKYHFECDDAASLPAQTAFILSKKIKISMASTAHTIDTDALYKMDSSGAWLQQSQPWQPLADYSVLSNKPQINGHTLTGNQSGEALGLQNALTFDITPTQRSTNPVTSGGIWTEQQRQETEIGVVANAGAKNLIPINNLTTGEDSYCSWTVNADNSVTVAPKSAQLSADWTKFVVTNFVLPAGTYIMSGGIAETSTSNKCDTYIANIDASPIVTIARGWTDGYQMFTLTQSTHIRFAIRIKTSYNSTTPVTFKPMVRSAEITDPTFQPYARTNRDLTVLTDEDRDALVELVDNGAKNIFQFDEIGTNATHGTTYTVNGITFTINSGGGIDISGTAIDDAYANFRLNNVNIDVKDLADGYHVISGVPYGVQSGISIRCVSGNTVYAEDTGNGSVMQYSGSSALRVQTFVANGTVISSTITLKPMICSTTAWKISQAYQPYRPSWQEMYDMILALQ